VRTNFKIISFIEIDFNGVEIDLHNNFDFIARNTKISDKQIVLHFRKSNGDWAKNVEFQNLYFVLDDYSFLKQIDPKIEFVEDDSCLAGITFFDNDFREENYGLIDRKLPNETDDIIFSFESERVIRANCEIITLKAE
jgi:hypothetical protein